MEDDQSFIQNFTNVDDGRKVPHDSDDNITSDEMIDRYAGELKFAVNDFVIAQITKYGKDMKIVGQIIRKTRNDTYEISYAFLGLC